MKFMTTAVLVMFLVSGCTWVKPTLRGEQVQLVWNQAEIATCKMLGKTGVTVPAKIGPFYRNQKKVEEELATLGRNSAAEMGGDTILPVSEVFQGERTFAVYSCRGN